jgi:hypothetical protein
MVIGARILLAIGLIALSGAAAPAAGAAWSAPRAVVGDAGASAVSGAGNRRGSEAFAWQVTTRRLVRVGRQSGLASYVRARVRRPDGRLGSVQTISSTRGLVMNPQIGVDDAGNVTAVWTEAGRHLSITGAYRPHGKRFGRPVELGRSGHFNDARPALAVGPSGDAVVAWNEGRSVRVVRRGVGPCRCFGAPVALRAGSDQTVAIGPLGSAYVVWAAEVRTAPGVVHTRLRMATFGRDGRRVGREHFLSTTGDASQPSLAVGRDGSTTVAWRSSLPAGGEQNDPAPIMAATSSPDAVLTPAQAVSVARGELPQVRVNAGGEAILAWNQINPTPGNPDGPQIAVALRPAGAPAFGAPATISPPNVLADSASLAVDSSGTAYLLYSADSGTGSRIAVSHVRAPASVFGPPLTLPPAFAGGTLVAAGAKVTAVSGVGGPAVDVSDWAP